MFRDWVLGRGPEQRVFGTCSPQSQNMADAFDVNRARQFMYRKNEGVPFEQWEPVTNFSGACGPIELVAAGGDSTGDCNGIAQYCKPENKVSVGFVEGFNNKIRVIQRMSLRATR
jgi:hypothetical protein